MLSLSAPQVSQRGGGGAEGGHGKGRGEQSILLPRLAHEHSCGVGVWSPEEEEHQGRDQSSALEPLVGGCALDEHR